VRGGSKKFEMHPLDTISRGWGTIVLSFCVAPNVMTAIKFVNFIEHTKNMFSIKCNTVSCYSGRMVTPMEGNLFYLISCFYLII